MNVTFDQAQSTLSEPAQHRSGVVFVSVSLETLLYLGIVALALVLRLAALNSVALDDTQAHEALAALHHANPDQPGEPVVARAPLMAFANMLIFEFADHSNFSARFATALVGVLMVLGPLLWRRYLGKSTALAMSALLAVSPVALTAARTLGAVTWTMALVFVGVWLIQRYAETRNKHFAIAATMSFGAIVLLTEPTGIITALGLLVGLQVASWLSQDEFEAPSSAATIRDLFSEWPWMEALMATLVMVIVVATGFFTTPDGLTSAGNTLYEFLRGILERPDETPRAFALLIALRYDFGLLLFGLVGLYFALREGDFFQRFLAGWLMWSILASIFYAGASADAGLWITVPAAGLTATIVARMLRSASSGYWYVPEWAIPVHAAVTIAFIVALGINVVTLSQAIQREARPVYNHVLPSVTAAARVGTFDENAAVNTFQVTPAIPASILVQLVPLDPDIRPTLRVEMGGQGLIYGPYEFQEGRRGLVVKIDMPVAGETYIFRVIQAEGQSYERGQYVFLTYPAEAENAGLLGTDFWKGYRLDVPLFWAVTRLIANQTRAVRLMVLVFTVMLVTILYFLSGSLWGSRAAWRGLGFGLLIYLTVYGLGLGWQASVTFANDSRELWYTNAPTTKLDRLVDTLRTMSRYDNGTQNKISVTVQGDDDGALAWALRDFEHTQYVNGLGMEINTGAVIAPPSATNPVLGASYVGQDVLLREDWALSDLSWMDFFSWLTLRDTRFNPRPQEDVMLWIRQDIYGVQQVPTQ